MKAFNNLTKNVALFSTKNCLITTAMFLLLICYLPNVSGQDRMLFQSGKEIQTKVMEIQEDLIKYKEWNHLDGPIYIIAKKDIYKINYQNGTTAIFNSSGENFPSTKLVLQEEAIPKTTLKERYKPFKYHKDRKVKFYAASAGIGGRVGMMGKFGFHLTVAEDLWEGDLAYLAGISKSIKRNKNFQWNVSVIGGLSERYTSYRTSYTDRRYSGATGGYFDYIEYETNYKYENILAYGIGTEVAIGHLYFSADAYMDEKSDFHYLVGVGYVF